MLGYDSNPGLPFNDQIQNVGSKRIDTNFFHKWTNPLDLYQVGAHRPIFAPKFSGAAT